MDPVAHTLFGATMAETGLRRLTRYATPTLIIGANLPDIDAIATVLGQDMSLYLRRGWTHGILAMVVLPAVLVGLVLLYHHVRGRHRDRDGPALHVGWLFALAYVSTWSHPTLDWMNTYGVRLLMPFDGTWFYGDTLFIIDPWFWLLTAAGVVLARSSSRKAIAGWALLGTLTSVLVLLFPEVPLVTKVLWVVGVVVIIALRWRRRTPRFQATVARVGLGTLVVYIGVMIGLGRLAESQLDGPGVIEVQSNPMPGAPFQQRVVVVYEDRYEVTKPDGTMFTVQRIEPTPPVEAALAADSVKGFANWTRFPYWSVEESADGYKVTFRDLRYVDPDEDGQRKGIGFVEVELDKQLKPR